LPLDSKTHKLDKDAFEVLLIFSILQEVRHESKNSELISCHQWYRLKYTIGEQKEKKRKKKLFDLILLVLSEELNQQVSLVLLVGLLLLN
jgi:hypothetical protein